MRFAMSKWDQHVLLTQNPLTADKVPKTVIYSKQNLINFIKKYGNVFVKHDTSGQGRAIFKIYKNKNGDYCINGYTIQGKSLKRCIANLNELHSVLHPFAKFKRESGRYIIQEEIQSTTLNNEPFCIRVHVQNIKGQWIVGGMFGKIGKNIASRNGIVNSYRDAQVMTVDELLIDHWNMDEDGKNQTIDRLQQDALSVANLFASIYPRREYGIDFGLTKNGKPMIFEVNTTPGIDTFAGIADNSIWKQIVENRKRAK